MSKSNDKKIEIREIVYSQDEEKSFGDVFIYEPENVEEQNLGNLFIVGDLKDLPKNCSYIMNVLASKIKKEFYANTKRTAEEGLEAGLSEANKTLADLADQGNGEYVGRLSMVCGTYHGNKFYLSQVGKIKSLLIRGGQIMEIIKEDDSKPVSAKRVFNNIASGDLSDGDLVIFATSGLFNIFSLEKLRQLGSSMKLDEFASKLQEEIEEEDSETVSALLIEIEGEKKNLISHSELEFNEKEPAEKSLEKALVEGVEIDEAEALEENESKPAEAAVVTKAKEAAEAEKALLAFQEEEPDVEEISPSESSAEVKKSEETGSETAAAEPLLSAVKEKTEEVAGGKSLAQAGSAATTAKTIEASAVKDTGKISLSDIIKEYEKMESRSLEQDTDTDKDKSIEAMVAKKEANTFEDLDEKKESVHKKISSNVKNYLQNLKSGKPEMAPVGNLKKFFNGKKEYKVRSANKKFSFLGKKAIIVVLLLVLAGDGYYYGSVKEKKENTAKLAAYQSLLDESKTKINQADVESISGSEESSGKLYLEARALALRVKNEYDALDTQADEVIANAQTQIDIIDKVAKVSGLEVLANFENENIKNLVEVNGTYYVIDDSENAVYKVDASKAEISQAAKAQEAIGGLLFAKNFQSQEILLSNGSEFSSFNLKNNQIKKLSTKADDVFTDFATYGRYVYLLSPAQNQIYKYQKTAQGLDGKTEWLKSGDIKNAVSLAIDQYVYILTSDGQIKKYFTGEEYADKDGNKFAIKQPSDAITSPTKIYTLTDQKNLYVVEPSKSRIVLFDKTTGALVKQLTGEGFSDIKDISVDAEEKNMAVLMKNKIVKIDLTK